MWRILLGFTLLGLGCGPEKQATLPKPTPITLDLGQSFDKATRSAEDPPQDVQKPADRTLTKKPTYKLVEQVKELWPKVGLTDASGKARPIRVKIETSLGKSFWNYSPIGHPTMFATFWF